LRSVLEEQLLTIDQASERVKRYDELLEVQVPQWRYYPAVQAVMCLRGFQLVAATIIIAELGDIRRFTHPNHVTGFLGLVPKEETTGDARRLGSITKAGNSQARWCLVEAVQKALLPPKVSARLSMRQEGQPAAYKELGWKIQVRLHKRGWHLMHRGVMKAKVNIALARELAGFLWDLLRQVPAPQP
jgi:transposase